jgi:hypothetical protein
MLIAAAIAVASIVPTHATAVEPLTQAEIRALPFSKAVAYAGAVDAYCFPLREYNVWSLTEAHQVQIELLGYDNNIWHLINEAHSHLKGDQAACERAMVFVDRIVGQLPVLKPRMDLTLKTGPVETVDSCRATADEAEQFMVKAPDVFSAEFSVALETCSRHIAGKNDALTKRIDAISAKMNERVPLE